MRLEQYFEANSKGRIVFLDFDRVLDFYDDIWQTIQDSHVLYKFNFEELPSVFAKNFRDFGMFSSFSRV